MLMDLAKNYGGYEWGGDLYVFENTNSPAKPVTTNGFDNPFNNGIRSSHVVNDKVYFGTSTWSNLGDQGGYELFEVYEDGPRITESTTFTSSEKCQNGGIRITVAADINGNNVIDENEPVIKTEELCNGLDGADGDKGDAGDKGDTGNKGDTGDKGGSGCSVGNGTDAGMALLIMALLVVLPIMLRRKS